MADHDAWVQKPKRTRTEWPRAGGATKVCGVWQLLCKANGKVLVGGANDVQSCGYTLLSRLRKGVHWNRRLQSDFAMYGADAFEPAILQGCAPKLLADRLAYWVKQLDAYNPALGYNRPPSGYATTPEERAARAERREADWKRKLAARGRKAGREARRKVRLDQREKRKVALGLNLLPVRMTEARALEVAKRTKAKVKPVRVTPKASDPDAAAREWAKQQGLDWERLVTG